MSMLGISLLREIVNKEYFTHTGVILRKLRKEIVKLLDQDKDDQSRDGMDVAICTINKTNNVLQYSGANNPLYIISKHNIQVISSKTELDKTKPIDYLPSFQKDDYNFYEIKPDKMPVGKYVKMDKFITHEIQLQEGDQLYMFSDGYADQFGGEKGKKFKYKPFKQMLLNNADKSMSDQKEILGSVFEKWKSELEQIDDVVVLGIKI